ncbi:MAG: hypothetical protein L6Q26_00285 [Anaerolineales bacterium]|nr:hypothetical protein [Anaerolineales bacterium]NUQ83801.1 DUF2029 domain-containing protein [Anaerolineales bacterium]
MINTIRENKGKSLLVAGIVLMWAALGILFNAYGYEKTWQLWNVPTEMPPFKDFRLIPGSAESFRNGFEPTITNPGDPNGRIFNYPFFWRLFFYTNITQDDTVWIVVVMLVLYFAGAILFPQKITMPDALLMLLVLFSPASMLLYERGNADLIVFFICAMIVLAANYSSYLTFGLILFGAVVKMFPFFGITVLLKESRRRFYPFLAAGAIFMVVYSLLTLDSQRAAWTTTMRGDGISYGTFVFITRLGGYVQEVLPGLFSLSQWGWLFEAVALVLILLAGFWAVREPNPLTCSHERNLTAFRMGASIYLGTFLLGNNWDYRLAFLVLVVPQLSQWTWQEKGTRRFVSVGVLIVSLVSCWHLLLNIDLPFIPLKDPANRIFVFDELVNWLMVPGFTYLLVASFPDWIRMDLRKFFGRAISRKVEA